ncbi:hypothetical protein ASPWEDRAFT_623110 [Aspergillus wentii DTO 134E9]|uniref:C2H2-type domain-containing protein n=1 Tax=Aspergillus wentii DTO 134E9 TaxID=1073089 RepID=A0A1L9RF24_ASPWE|nr:uncharacterized protein ASPWEDRAFT_623110 [Aspergillus wentii DTO 134E9]OJJ33467.1 hypothetical protein ASPWEDRAFT_623110 [Aspergillus wentii DTO 134E9]
MAYREHSHVCVDSTDDASHDITDSQSSLSVHPEQHPTDSSLVDLTIDFGPQQEQNEAIKGGKINRSKCKWEVAPIRNFFNRDTDLMRHIKHIHVSPRTYSCNINRCRKSCSRKGNLMQHIRTHQKSHRAQLDLVNGSSVE